MEIGRILRPPGEEIPGKRGRVPGEKFPGKDAQKEADEEIGRVKVSALLDSEPIGSQSKQPLTFPTEQRNRQKVRKKAGHTAPNKPQKVEQHHDD